MTRSSAMLFLRMAVLFLWTVSAYSSNNNGDDDDGGNQSASGSVYVDNCDGSVVQVISLTVLCDSPNTYYYGNGAYRNSETCEYGDKAKMQVCFEVTEDLSDTLEEIYVTMGVYAGGDTSEELLYSIRAGQLCNSLVGNDACTVAGNYCFKLQKTLDTPAYGTESQFYPTVSMAFSSYPDEGYDLGSVNGNCASSRFDSWLNSDTKIRTHGGGTFLANYGVVLGVGICLVAFALFAMARSTPEPPMPTEDVQRKIDLLHQEKAMTIRATPSEPDGRRIPIDA